MGTYYQKMKLVGCRVVLNLCELEWREMATRFACKVSQ